MLLHTSGVQVDTVHSQSRDAIRQWFVAGHLQVAGDLQVAHEVLGPKDHTL